MGAAVVGGTDGWWVGAEVSDAGVLAGSSPDESPEPDPESSGLSVSSSPTVDVVSVVNVTVGDSVTEGWLVGG